MTTASNDYLLHGQCVPMETLTDQESWSPNLADSTPGRVDHPAVQRTAYGIVIARATIKGKPVAYTNLRSTYMHELDSAAGFAQFNDPSQMRNPQDFFNAASKIGYTFNWFYADDQHTAYFNSGQNPVRAPHTDPLFPSLAKYAWKGLVGAAQMTPQSLVERDAAPNAHPARRRPGRPDELEQQAGSRLRRPERPDSSTPRSSARSCWTTTSPTTCGSATTR